jgi:hypothetical protein
MKLFFLNLFLLLSGNDHDSKKVEVVSSAKAVIETVEEAYSAKEPIEGYSAKSVKVPIKPPDFLMNPLNRLTFPVVPPLPPINPPPVTNVNP